MSQIFYIVRHGETDWNALRRLQGHSDIPLNDQGIKQAEGLKQRLLHLKIDKVISSDLCRARETARIAFGGELILSADLREVHLGRVEGLTRETIIEKEGEAFWQGWASHLPEHLDHRFPEGESKREMLDRILRCFKTHLSPSKGQTLAFVSHGLVMRTLTHYLRPGLEDTHFIANCGVLKLSYHHDQPGLEFKWLEYFDSTRDVT